MPYNEIKGDYMTETIQDARQSKLISERLTRLLRSANVPIEPGSNMAPFGGWVALRAWGREESRFNSEYGIAGLAIRSSGIVTQETHIRIQDSVECGEGCRGFTLQLDSKGKVSNLRGDVGSDYGAFLVELEAMEGVDFEGEPGDHGDPTKEPVIANYAQILDITGHVLSDPLIAHAFDVAVFRGTQR